MKNLNKKVAVITGAGSGMGRELALQLTQKGTHVALNDWNETNLLETLQLVKNNEGTAIGESFDVTSRQAVYDFAQKVITTFGQVDIVINNAGIALPAMSVQHTDYDSFEKLVNINLWGVIYGTKAFLPHLQQRPEAALVNISSVFGIMGFPTQGAYCTSKFAVKGFSETLRLELAGEKSKVQVTCVHPGGIKTNIVRNIDHQPGSVTEEDKKEMAKAFDKNAPTTAASAASQIIRAIQKKKPRLLIGKDARFIDFLVRLLPTKYAGIILKKFTQNENERLIHTQQPRMEKPAAS